MPTADAEFEQLSRRLEELRTSSDPAQAKERAELQKKLSDILVSRRKSDRFQCHIRVDVKAGDATGTGVMSNIGPGGAYVRTTLVLARFADLALTVNTAGRLPAGTVFTASVRWAKPSDGVGVAFGALDPRVAELLKKVVGELVREQPPRSALPP